MTRVSSNVEFRNFTGGINTEASLLAFPENAAITLDNIDLRRNGEIRRRLGLDFEAGFVKTDTSKTTLVFDDHAIAAHRWDNVDNTSSVSIGVIQVGNNLWFVDLYASSPSANLLNGGAAVVLNSSTIGTNISGNELIQFAATNGVLVFTSKEMPKPHYLSYNSTTDVVSVTAVNVKVRDFFGIDDGLEIEERPSSLSNSHKYNLLNQGWLEDFRAAINGGIDNPLEETKRVLDVYPSNSDMLQFGKVTTESESVDDIGSYSPNILDRNLFGNTPAPKGHYIIDAFDRGSSRASESGVTGIPSEQDNGRISTVEFFAGRIFYSGVRSSVANKDDRSPTYEGYVFFTQVLNSLDKLGRCYQEADPTSEEISDLVDTDGGFISIPDASNILKLIAVDRSIVVIAENGVWAISGGETNFTATNFEISKISNIGCVSASSIVDAEGTIFYWAKSGIYVLTADQVSGKLVAQNITENTIQTFYNDVPGVGKAFSTGVYDPAKRLVKWMYNDTDDYDGVTLRHKFNREIVLDTTLSAFYTNTFSELTTDSPFVSAYITTPSFQNVQHQQSVVVNGEQVQVNGEDVVVTTTLRTRGLSAVKYVTFIPVSGGNYRLTLSELNNADFKDWEREDNTGIDAPAILESGDNTFQDTMRKKQATYLVMHFNRTEDGFELDGNSELQFTNPSGAFVQARWDFSDSGSSGKFGTKFQAYRLRRPYIPSGPADTFDYGQKVVTTRNKIRGTGKALRFRVESEAGKDMQVLGWAIVVSGMRNV